jgi:tetratricopeptide (TPR) repeat protein
LVFLFWIRDNRSLDIKTDFSTKLYGDKVLSGLPSDSIIFSEYLWFPLLYLQQIEHKRPDITVILQGEIFAPEYFEAVSSKRFPNIKHIDMSNNNNTTPYDYFWDLAKINSTDQHLFWEPDGQFQKLIADYITPYGLLFSFDPYNKREITKDEIEQMSVYLENLQMHNMENIEEKYYIANKINYLANFWSKLQHEEQVLSLYNAAIKIWPQGETINNNYGAYLMSKGSLLQASQYLKKSYEISSNDLITNKNLANFLFRIKDYHNSLSFLENFMKKSKSKDEDIESLLGAVYYELKKYEKAEIVLESALEILENKSKINKNYVQDEIKTKWIRLYKELCYERLTT